MGFLDAAADLLLGATCPGCDAPSLGVCATCTATLRQQSPHVVRRPRLTVAVSAAAPYRPLLDRVIPSFKDDGAWGCARLLSTLLATSVAHHALTRDVMLVPVPSRPDAVRRRGLDHARVLARAAAARLGIGWAALLSRLPGGVAQRGLDRSGRLELTTQRLRARRSERPVLVVDDVVTTGATLCAAVDALRRVGVTVIGAAVIADANTLHI